MSEYNFYVEPKEIAGTLKKDKVPVVECHVACRALLNPQSKAELRKAYVHWRYHVAHDYMY